MGPADPVQVEWSVAGVGLWADLLEVTYQLMAVTCHVSEATISYETSGTDVPLIVLVYGYATSPLQVLIKQLLIE